MAPSTTMATTAKVTKRIGISRGNESRPSRPSRNDVCGNGHDRLFDSGDGTDRRALSRAVRISRTRPERIRAGAEACDVARPGAENGSAARVLVVFKLFGQHVVDSGETQSALVVDRHHLAHAHLDRVDAHVQDAQIEIGLKAGVVGDRRVFTGPFQREVGLAVERAAALAHLLHPLREVVLRQVVELEAHAGEPGAGIVGGKAVVDALLVDHRMQLRLHARHGVDLTGERGDEEGVHHRRGRDLEGDRTIDGRGKLVDSGAPVFEVEEQPFPVGGDDLDLERRDVLRHSLSFRDAVKRAVGGEHVGGDPGDRSETDDDQKGGRPDEQLQLQRVIPVGFVSCIVPLAIASGEIDRKAHDRQHDDEHQDGGQHDEVALLDCHVACWVQNDEVTASQKRQEGEGEKGAGPTQDITCGSVDEGQRRRSREGASAVIDNSQTVTVCRALIGGI